MIRQGVAVVLGVCLAVWFTRRDVAPLGSGRAQESLLPPEEFPSEVQGAAEQAISAVKDATAGTVAMIFGTKYDSLINASAAQAGIDPKTLFNLLWQESRFREDIINGTTRSPTGALGIAQFMPPTAREWLGSESAALDPNQAIPGAARYLAWLKRQFNGDMVKAVAAYNWGIGNMKKKGLGSAPAETQNYVLSILGVNIA